MKCPKCDSKMKEVKVKIQDAHSPVTSYQCGKCGYFDFEEKSINRAIGEIKAKEAPLKIKQKIIKPVILNFYFISLLSLIFDSIN